MDPSLTGLESSGELVPPNFSSESKTLAEIIQVYCQANRTGRVTLNLSSEFSAQVFFQHGQVLHAIYGKREGERAVYEMLQLPATHFQFEEGTFPTKKTIHLTWEQLLIEAVMHENDPKTDDLIVEEPVESEPVVMTRTHGGQPKLTVVSGEMPPATFEVTKEFTHIGRNPENEIVLPVPSVSGRHCLITIHPPDIVLQDLNSFNGTSVNGNKITSVILQVGDTIQLGTIVLKFESAFKRPKLMSSTAEAVPNSVSTTGILKAVTPPSASPSEKKSGPVKEPQLDKTYVSGAAPIVYHDLKGTVPQPPSRWLLKLTIILAMIFIVAAAGLYVFLTLKGRISFS